MRELENKLKSLQHTDIVCSASTYAEIVEMYGFERTEESKIKMETRPELECYGKLIGITVWVDTLMNFDDERVLSLDGEILI